MGYGLRFLRGLIGPFLALKEYLPVFRKAKPRGRAALVFGTALLGGGRFFTGEIFRGFALLLIEAIAILYYIYFGFPILAGTIDFPGLGLEF